MKTAIATITVIWLALAGLAAGQQVISASAGLINYSMGSVLLDGKSVEQHNGRYPQMKQNSLLETKEGRAEILLTPSSDLPVNSDGSAYYRALGGFLRVGEHSAVRMVSTRITDARLDLVRGSVILECVGMDKDEAVTVTTASATITFQKNGLYRLDADPGLLRVYDGQALVKQGTQVQTVGRGKRLILDGVAVAEKFDTKSGDDLFRWTRRRAEYLAYANVSAAKYARNSGYGYSSWVYNPWFGMYTYLPYRGLYHSFWGYSFYSPGAVYAVYAPPQVSTGGGFSGLRTGYDASRGYNTVSATSAGTSGTVASSGAATSASSSSSAPVSRTTGSAGGSRR